MTSFEKHIEKYRLFKKDAENETVSHMSRIEALFLCKLSFNRSCNGKA